MAQQEGGGDFTCEDRHRHITTKQVHKWQWQTKATRYRTVAAEGRRRYNNVIAINNYNRDSNDGYEHNENMRTGIQ